MRSSRVILVLVASGGILAVGLVAIAWTLGAGSSEAQEGAMQNCPRASKWAISVWSGDDGTDPGEALATCGEGAVNVAYYIDSDTQAWSRWFAGQPELSNLQTLNDMQGVIALGAVGAPAPAPTPVPTPTPIVFQMGDADTSFHVDTASFRLAWTIEAACSVLGCPTVNIRVIPQGEATAVCSAEHSGSGSASKVCDVGPGDFYLEVSKSGLTPWGSINSWRVEITPL